MFFSNPHDYVIEWFNGRKENFPLLCMFFFFSHGKRRRKEEKKNNFDFL
jgi:hypothetical protein